MSKEVKERFESDLEESQKYMKPIHQKMDKAYEQYRNRLQHDEEAMNISDVYAYTETIVPILTNNRVRAMVKSEYPDYIKHAVGMEYILDYVFDTNNWDYEQQDIVRKAMIYRSGLAYTGYDENANNGVGKLTIIPINPRWTYVDPAATNLEDSSYFIYVEPMRDTQVKKMYPDKADKIGKKDSDGEFEHKSRGWFKNLVTNVKSFIYTGTEMDSSYNETTMQELTEEQKRKSAIAFIHYWYRDDEDNWRVAYFADDLFLEDQENPFWHEKLPYDIFSPTKDILSSLGIPMSEQIEDISLEKNILFKMFVQNAKRTAKPPLLYNSSVGVKDPRQLLHKTYDDGVVGIDNPDFFPLDSVATFMQMPQLPGWADSLPERMQSSQDYITGVNDSFRGMADATSGKEVQLKQEAAYTRIKTMVDNFELFTKSIAQKVVVNAMQFVDESVFRVKGDYKQLDSMISEDDPFEVAPIPSGMNDEGEEQYDKHEFFMYANPNAWTQEEVEDDKEGAQEAYTVLSLLVEIEAGSSLPTSRQAKREETLELFSAGIVDQQYVLEQFDIADADEILKRMGQQMEAEKEREAQMMQQQQQQQMMQQQGGVPMAQMPPQGGMPPQQGMPQQQPDLASMIDQLRQQVPELANASDDEIMQLLQQMQTGQGQMPQ